ncbi:hypothetical protein NQ314_012273 [Rhamnusium bicolor]|uniref:Inward rectifier potassium channel C-terminal domain-containing protein n=1 Tax=Rhamnusium bicolor TaxID=1586634 RepID=A0AAV8XDK5_9CUCU|nr:hypothetical protein NQ314_012273 [Rhamnusium bicolor]
MHKRTKEGEKLKYFETDLEVECDNSGTDLFFIWPVTIVHKINEDSPFYNLSATDMLQCKFEVVVVLDGTIESTGQGTSAKTSYLANEILWGHRFETMVTFNDNLQCYEANYDHFDKTLKVEMPMCSASKLASSPDSEGADQDKDKEEKSNDERSEKNKSSLDLPQVPIRRHINGYKHHTCEESATEEQQRQRSLSLELPSKPYLKETPPHLPIRQVRSQRSSISQDHQSRKPISDYYHSRRNMFELQSPNSRSHPQPKMGKSVLNRYEYSHYTHYENIPEGNERSETPPFPISWV